MKTAARSRRRFVACVFLACIAIVPARSAHAQGSASRPTSSVAIEVFDFNLIATLVRANHPIARNARVAVEAARADERIARGGFDPTISGSVDQKTYKGTQYYGFGNVKLAVPTPFGVDVQFGFERAMGTYLNPERRVPSRGLFSAGFKIPLGQRIITDERRTALAVARAGVTSAEADSASAVNKLLLQVAKDFSAWYEAAWLDSLVRGSETLASVRLGAVRQRVLQGEAPAIDTIEATLELTRRRVLRVDTERNRINARLQLETDLWGAHGEPLALDVNSVPQLEIFPANWPRRASAMLSDSALKSLIVRHPDVLKARARETQLSASRRLAFQGLLPNAYAEASAISIDANQIVQPTDQSAKLSATLTQSVFMIRERNRLNAAGLRLTQANVDVTRVERDVQSGIGMAQADVRATQSMLELQQRGLELARLLQQGEQRRFEAGESTVFLINTRDRSVLDESMKLISLKSKLFASLMALQNARGIVDDRML